MVASFRRIARFESLKTPAKEEEDGDDNNLINKDIYHNTIVMASSRHLEDAVYITTPKDDNDEDGGDLNESREEVAKGRNEESVLLRSQFKKRRNHVIAPKDDRRNEEVVKGSSSSPALNFNPVLNTSMNNNDSVSFVLRPPSSPKYATSQYMKNPDQCWNRSHLGVVTPDDFDRSWDFSKPSFDQDVWDNSDSDAFPFSITPTATKISPSKKSKSFSPEECLNDLLNFESRVEASMRNNKKWIVKVTIQPTEECSANAAAGPTTSEAVQSMTTANENHNKKSNDFTAEMFAYLSAQEGEDTAKSKSMPSVNDKEECSQQVTKKIVRNKVTLKGGDDGASENSDELKCEIGTELQYKTPSKTTKKQTTVVLPSHEQIYCEILTTSPSNGKERKNEFPSIPPINTEKNVKDADKISSYNLEDFSPFPFDDFGLEDSLVSERESQPEHSESFGSDSQTTLQPKQLCFTPSKNDTNDEKLEGNYPPAPTKPVGEQDLWPAKRTKNKENRSEHSLSGLIRKVVLKQNETPQEVPKEKPVQENKLRNENGMQLKNANVMSTNEFENWSHGECFMDNSLTITPKGQGLEKDKPEVGLNDARSIGEPSMFNPAVKQEGTSLCFMDSFERDNSLTITPKGQGLKNEEPGVGQNAVHLDGEPSVLNPALKQKETALGAKINMLGLPSVSVPSKGIANVLDFKSVLMTETMDVIKYIDCLVQDVISDFEPSERKDSDGDNDSDFKDVLKSMVTDIVLGHSTTPVTKNNNQNNCSVAKTSSAESSTNLNQCSAFELDDNSVNTLKTEKAHHNLSEGKSELRLIPEVEKTPDNLSTVNSSSNAAPVQQGSEEYFESNQAISDVLNPVLSPNDVSCFPTSDTQVMEDGPEQSQYFVQEKGSDETGRPEIQNMNRETKQKVSNYTPLKGLPSISQRIAALKFNEK